MLTLIIGIVVGAIITWILAHHYYIRATKDQSELFHKLDDNLRETILNDRKEKLSIKELNELLESKTIDKTHGGLFPFKACPKCGSENLRIGTDNDPYHDGDDYVRNPFELIQCLDCGWSKTEFDVNKNKS